MNKTTIPWVKNPDGTQGFTWNPTTGCTFGCDFCYARKVARRFCAPPKDVWPCGPSWTCPCITQSEASRQEAFRFDGRAVVTRDGCKPFPLGFTPTMYPSRLGEPLRRKKPAVIFLGSMGDVFDPAIPDAFRDRIFATVAAAHWHTFVVLTKRAYEMRQYYRRCGDPVPLPNLVLGVSVANQADADERIPLLLDTPAAKRMVSVEPMLGPVEWFYPRLPVTAENAPESWDDFPWPEWVPDKVRDQVRNFWSCFGRRPIDYIRSAQENDAPPLGMHMRQEYESKVCPTGEGRWVFCWNNMGRLITDSGETIIASIPRSGLFDVTRYNWQPLDFVAVGGKTPGKPLHERSACEGFREDGETGEAVCGGKMTCVATSSYTDGPDGISCHHAPLSWLRSLRDQCLAAGVPFHYKQRNTNPALDGVVYDAGVPL